jgi:hypothetical protein
MVKENKDGATELKALNERLSSAQSAYLTFVGKVRGRFSSVCMCPRP